MLHLMYQQELCKLSYLKYLLKIKLEFKYGLLSPSGCGKTTLLRYIVDRLQLNKTSLNNKTRTCFLKNKKLCKHDPTS